MPEDEALLLEDETCSIWTCRYGSDVVFPPHEHCVKVHIAVYRGSEVEVLYHREPGRLRHAKNRVVTVGEVATLGADAAHAVTGEGDGQSLAIHTADQGGAVAVRLGERSRGCLHHGKLSRDASAEGGYGGVR